MSRLGDAIYNAIDWDFVDVFAGEPDAPGFDGPHDFAESIADNLSLRTLVGATYDLLELMGVDTEEAADV